MDLLQNCKTPIGGKVFHASIASESARWLKVALEARGVASATKLGLHALRRGSARALVANGGDLGTILVAGGWKSAALSSYLDMMGVEQAALVKGTDALVDIHSGEE